jgi:hypothetical protein
MMETIRTSEWSVNYNETTRRNIPKGSNLHTRRRENLKPHMCSILLHNPQTETSLRQRIQETENKEVCALPNTFYVTTYVLNNNCQI